MKCPNCGSHQVATGAVDKSRMICLDCKTSFVVESNSEKSGKTVLMG